MLIRNAKIENYICTPIIFNNTILSLLFQKDAFISIKPKYQNIFLIELSGLIWLLKVICVQNYILISFSTALLYNKVLKVRNASSHTRISNANYLITHLIQTKGET